MPGSYAEQWETENSYPIQILNSAGEEFDAWDGPTIFSPNYQLKAVVNVSDLSPDFVWFSREPDIATVDQNGRVTFKKRGCAYIGVEGTNLYIDKYICYEPTPADVFIQNSAGIARSYFTTYTNTYQLKATSYLAGKPQEFSWESSDTSIATVNANGLVTFKKPGEIGIMVTAKDGSGKHAEVTVTYRSIKIQNSSGTDVTGKTVTTKVPNYQLKATAAPKLWEVEEFLIWKLNNPDIASVNSAGKVSFRKAGTVTVTVYSFHMDNPSDRKLYSRVKITYAPDANTCGTNVKYAVSGSTATFTGSGSAAEWGLDCTEVFRNKSGITNVTVNGKITVRDGNELFAYLPYVKEMNLAKLDVSALTSLQRMFYACPSLTKPDISTWNTSKVKSMNGMFGKCVSLASLDISGWDTSAVTSAGPMFKFCNALNTLKLGKNSAKVNIFRTLPNYNNTWYYFAAGAAAGKPIALDSAKQKGELFTAYNYNTMAGTWTSDKNKIQLVNDFVSRCYQNILGRKADQSGLTYYAKQLREEKLTGAQMVMNFVNSPEFQGKKYSNEKVVEILYITMMDRTADAKGRAYWAGFLNDGMSQKYIVRGFAGSAEFKNICARYGINAGTLTLTENRDKNPKVTAFVSRNYSIALGRKGDADGLNYWTGMILTKKLTPQKVADSFVFSKECVDKKLNNTEFVKMLYKLYMGREFDQSGLNYWLGKMKSGMTRQTVAKSFGGSKEFKEIVASYGL